MLLPTAFLTYTLLISLGRCQFVYNYEESDADTPNDSEGSALYKYNPPAATNDRFQQDRVVKRQPPTDEIQRTGISHSSERGTSYSSEPQEQPESISENENPRNEPSQRTRRRKYKRVHKEGNYFEPPQRPMVYSPSVFENIGLGQAPSGVYVPQDSFLNVLRNPTYRREMSSHYNAPQNISPYSGNYQQPSFQVSEPQPRFFVQPPLRQEERTQRNRMASMIQPSVQYSSDPSVSSESADPSRHAAQRPRQSNRPRPEPTVDIDVLRSHPDVMPAAEPSLPQARQATQARSVSQNRRRQIVPIQSYQNPISSPRVYSPSVFQNIGLGEAPSGVHIPQDSLLNVLRDSPPRTQSAPRQVMRNPEPEQELPDRREEAEQNYYQPPISDQLDYTSHDSRRRSRQRSRTVRVSGQTNERRTNRPSDIEEQEAPSLATPAPSQPQRRQRPNRRQETNVSERRPSERRQTVRAETKPSQVSSTRPQHQNFKPAKLAIAALPEDTDDDGIPGEAGVDYPTLHVIPRTVFSCAQQEHNGYYADLETSCQVVHLCQAGGVKSSFLCPNGTIFSQEKFSCQWWYKVNCEDSPRYYAINDSLYKIPERKKSNKE